MTVLMIDPEQSWAERLKPHRVEIAAAFMNGDFISDIADRYVCPRKQIENIVRGALRQMTEEAANKRVIEGAEKNAR